MAAARRWLSHLRAVRRFAHPSCLLPPRPVPFASSAHYKHQQDLKVGAVLAGQVMIFLGLSGSSVFAEEDPDGEFAAKNEQVEAHLTGLQKIEDGSVVSNEHTIKWRIFTDNGRELFLKGKLDEAEKYFQLAISEAKEGFGKRDPHVASSYNNLAELYRTRKEFNKAEPLYLEAVRILEESYGTDDIRVGAALHNLGQLYHVQRMFDRAEKYYERALKIEGRVLGHGHPDYANTMYHLGKVLLIQGKEKDGETLILNSIKILEEIGLGESSLCISRMSFLAQKMRKSRRLAEAESLQRKILHTLELSNGWNSVTIAAAEALALTLESLGNLKESRELLERCLAASKVLSENHVLVASNSFHLARLALLNAKMLRKTKFDSAKLDLDEAKRFVDDSIRITKGILNSTRHKRSLQSSITHRELRVALIIFFKSVETVGLLDAARREIVLSTEPQEYPSDVENALRQCISLLKEPHIRRLASSISEVREVFAESIHRLSNLVSNDVPGSQNSKELRDLIVELQQILTELS